MKTPEHNQHEGTDHSVGNGFGGALQPSNHDDLVAMGYGETAGYASHFDIGEPHLPEYKPESLVHSVNRQVPPMVKIAIALGVILLVMLAGMVYVSFSSPTVEHPAVQAYVAGEPGIVGNVDTEEFLQASPDFAIGATAEGKAVFKDPEQAFATFKTTYAEVIEAVRGRNGLLPFSPSTYAQYKQAAWQSHLDSASLQEQAAFMSRFLDIYENSF